MTIPGAMLSKAPAYFTVPVPASLSILGEWTQVRSNHLGKKKNEKKEVITWLFWSATDATFLASFHFMFCYLWAKPGLFLICSQTFFGVLASLRREFISVEDMPDTLLHSFNNNEDNY